MNKKPSFSGRKKARRYALQALYGWLLSENLLQDIEKHSLLEHVDEKFDIEYFQILLHKIPEKKTELDALFSPYLNRALDSLDPIELIILRIAIFEFKERLDVPYRVIINEALELAKTFGSTDSHKFVNGVLDKAARKLRPTEVE